MVEKSKVKYIQSLSQKKQRDEEGVFVAEGPKIINDLLKENAIELLELFATEKWISSYNPAGSLPVNEIDDITLGKISLLSTPNQVLGIFKIPANAPFVPAARVSLLLQTIQDPGNMGSVIRCADWFGIEQVVCSRDCVDVYNPKTVQATMGSIGRVKVYYDDLEQVIERSRPVKIYAAALSGKNINEMDALTEALILIGNESKGISQELMQLADEKITIPGKGKAESLNAAVAAGILLSRLTR